MLQGIPVTGQVEKIDRPELGSPMPRPRVREGIRLAGKAREGVGRHEDDHSDNEIREDAEEQPSRYSLTLFIARRPLFGYATGKCEVRYHSTVLFNPSSNATCGWCPPAAAWPSRYPPANRGRHRRAPTSIRGLRGRPQGREPIWNSRLIETRPPVATLIASPLTAGVRQARSTPSTTLAT